MMKMLQISIPKRMILIRTVIVLSLIVSVLLSIHVWGGYRSVPYTSLIGDNPIPAPFDFIYVGVIVLLLLASLFFVWQRFLLCCAVALCVLLVLFDLNRLQPWLYVYCAMLMVFVFYNGRVDDSNKFTAYFIILQIVFASVYFFCGLSQLNSLFIESDFSHIISPMKTLMSERQFLFFKRAGFIVPYMFMFIGLGLIISPIRYLAITLGVFIHILLLVFLFPSVRNQNYVLWFSNFSFIVILILLFSGKTKQKYFSPTFLFQIPYFYLVFFLFVVMPFFNNSGTWPDYLSSNFRSGNTNKALIFLSEKSAEGLPETITRFCRPHYNFLNFDYRSWCLQELNVECYPDRKVFSTICDYLKKNDKKAVKEIELQLLPKQKLLLKP